MTSAPTAAPTAAELEAFLGVAPSAPRSLDDERAHRQAMLVAGLRILAASDMEEGVAGHVTARDPEHEDRFWVNPFGAYFGTIEVDDLLLVDHAGRVLHGNGIVNPAGYDIHSAVHRARPDVVACAHTHASHGMALSCLGETLLPLTQTAAAFFEDHVLLDHYPDADTGVTIASALGTTKAAILAHHGLLTVGRSVESCIWWFVSFERQARVQLLAQAAGTVRTLPEDTARRIAAGSGSETVGVLSFGSLLQRLRAG